MSRSKFVFRLGVAGCLSLVQAQVVINEVHYDPDVKVEPVEFVEILNTGPDAVDVSGWALSDAVDFSFPAGTILVSGAYLVVGENPGALQSKFGATALGPWVGSLRNEGDVITLKDAQGVTVDKVAYGLGFPWPTVGDPPGYSIELVNPAFDNDLGGNWRVSVAGGVVSPSQQTLFGEGESWLYFKGESEASSPTTAWREIEFNDSGWLSGDAPIGYGENFINTPLADMQDGYTSVFFRKTFQVTDPSQLGELTLEVNFDDGFKAWINGVVVVDGNANLPAGELAYDGTASGAIEDQSFRTYAVGPSPAVLLVPGENVIAIQGHNASIGGSSDFWVDARLTATVGGGASRGPTPGAKNSAYLDNVAPQIRQVDHSPNRPSAGEPVRISAKVTDPEGVSEMTLHYQLVDPGNYIELEDSAYESDWTSVAMNDNGVNGDEFAGDSVYSVQLPGSMQTHRRLVRYRMTATDGAGASVRVPYEEDPQPNFAYFVYSGVPGWRGSIRPGVEPVVDFSAEEMGRLPAYHLISKQTDVETATWFEKYGGDLYKWRGTLVYDGEVYDHISYRARGGVWRYAMVKNMWKLLFNRGHYFQARDNWGRKFNTKWRRLNLGASIQQGDYQHRGEQGMFESVGFRLFDLARVEAPHTAFITFRIIDEAEESYLDNQFEGDFWGIYLVAEQMDGRFLDEHGLPDGNLYKMENGTGPSGANGELKNQGPTQVTDTSDLISWRQVAEGSNSQSDDWWRQTFDLDRYFGYQAMLQAFHHYDVCCGKNYYYYHNPVTGLWQVHPWDLDLTWSDNMYVGGVSGGTEPFRYRLLSDFSNSPGRPQITLEFKNRVRELRDLLFNTDEAWRLIDEYAALLQGTNSGPTILDADRAMWDYNPKMASSSYSSSLGKAGQGRFYQAGTPTRDFAGMVQKMKNYVAYRASSASLSPVGSGLDGLARDTAIPSTPTVSYAGPAGYPLNRLSFVSSAYQGPSGFSDRQWRIAEINPAGAPAANPKEPNKYEIDAAWMTAPGVGVSELTVDIPSDAVRVGSTYRVRSRVKDNTGRWSHWSAPAQFVVGPIDGEVALVDNLRLTELMVDPAEGDGLEFIELYNRSSSLALDLDGVKFTDGVDYAFASGMVLPPRSYLLVVASDSTNDFAVFRQHYGLDEGVRIVGPYAGRLSDQGERVVLKAGRAGTAIVDFEYGSSRAWPVAAQGAGHSLVPLARAVGGQSTGALDYPGNWRASALIGGSPGASDPEPPAPTLRLNEIVAHTDFSDPLRPEYDSNDWIELVHRGPAAVDTAEWFLSDDTGDLRKWRIPSRSVAPGELVVYTEVDDFHSPITEGFGLDKAGEQLLLSHLPASGPGRVVDAVGFKGQENDWALGRNADNGEFWMALNPRTPDGVNGSAQASVIISELMYHPPSVVGTNDNVLDEYVELFNPGTSSIDLFNTNGMWRLDGGIGFEFTGQRSLAAGETLLVVNFDPADTVTLGAFRTRYGLDASLTILGPYSGKLGNRSDRVGLEKPQFPDLPGDDYSWVVIDEVTYGNQDPWPDSPHGTGTSLHRIDGPRSGDDPSNWQAGEPTPGIGLTSLPEDADQDGMLDDWERQHGLDPNDPGDAGEDADGDLLTNLEEFLAGTDPNDDQDLLVLIAQPAGSQVILQFNRKANRSYSILSRDGLETDLWEKVADVEAGMAEEPYSLPVDADVGAGARFYLLVTPVVQ